MNIQWRNRQRFVISRRFRRGSLGGEQQLVRLCNDEAFNPGRREFRSGCADLWRLLRWIADSLAVQLLQLLMMEVIGWIMLMRMMMLVSILMGSGQGFFQVSVAVFLLIQNTTTQLPERHKHDAICHNLHKSQIRNQHVLLQ